MRPQRAKFARAVKEHKTVAGPSVESHTSQWEAPFDLSALPPELAEECIRCAPFLFGGPRAKYDADFFKLVVNLNNGGSVMADFIETKCARKKFEDKWPPVEGRYYLADAKNEKVWDAALSTYIQVYGGPPNNGDVGTQFLCAIYMETMHGKKVNWSEWAAKITSDCLKNARRNPLKLTPPALREQIERILKILGDAASTGTNRNPGMEHEQQVSRGKKSSEAKRDSKDALLQLKVTLDPTGKTVEKFGSSKAKVERTNLERRGMGNIGKETQKAMTSTENSIVSLEADLEDVKRKEVNSEGVLKRLLKSQCCIKVKLAEAQAQHARMDAETSRLGDAFAVMHQRRSILIKEGDANGKKEVDVHMRKNAQDLAAVTQKMVDVEYSITKLEGDLEESKQVVDSIESNLKRFKSLKQQLILETATVKPRQVFWKLPDHGVELHFQEDLPCALWNMFFVNTAVVPFSCGCFFHFHCLWSTVLIGGNNCPRCSEEGTPQWLSQWGFSMSPEMAHRVKETIINMDKLGWKEPDEFNTKQWGLKKRAREFDVDEDSFPIKMKKHAELTEVHQKLLEPKSGKTDIEPKMLLTTRVEATGEAKPEHQSEEPSLIIEEVDEAKSMEYSLVAAGSTLKVQELANTSLDVGDLEVLETEKTPEELEVVEEKVLDEKKVEEHPFDVGDSDSKL